MQHSNIFTKGKELYAPLLIKERLLMGMFAATAIAGTFTPVIFPNQPNPSKLIQQIWGLFASGCFTAAAYTRKQKEKDYQAITTANHTIVKEHLKGEFAYEQSKQQIDSKRQLAAYVNSLPESERERWMQAYGLHGLVKLPQIQQAVIEAPARQLTGYVPTPDIADVNEDAVQAIINPGVMQILEDMAMQYPQYIRLDPEWIDELCDSASLHNMSDRANHHFMLVGGTQSGKSTLAGVIINKIAAKSQKPAIVLGSDPKDAITRWLCKFSRRFDGMEKLNEWVKFAVKVVERRKQEIGELASTNGIAEIFFVQDEVDTCYGGGKGFPGLIPKETALELQSLWNFIAKFTGGLKCHGVFIGQSPLSEATGFSRPNLKNLCFITLGQLSSYILGKPADFLNVKPEIVELFKQICELLDKEGMRYALVIPTRSNPYIALIPTFNIEGTEQKYNKPPEPSSEQYTGDWYEEIKLWVDKLGRQPTTAELKAVWLELVGKELNDNGVALLMEHLGFKDLDHE
ncbi:hypothetical protein [uncultured Nostoc sp.]|uniref:hypothetical protein n=1 Tax=uncultured Nostoc sp. TaxID=340711 RepID=UPI0035CB0764